jgi:hypothetical protein
MDCSSFLASSVADLSRNGAFHVSVDTLPEVAAFREGFSRSLSSGLICARCHSQAGGDENIYHFYYKIIANMPNKR